MALNKILPNFPIDPGLVTAPVGGRLSLFLDNWAVLTQNVWILHVVKGYSPEFLTEPRLQLPSRSTHRMNREEKEVDNEVQSLLAKRAIKQVTTQTLGSYSSLFVVPKKDGGWRPVIDLKSLNTYLRIPHFKMEGIQSLRDILSQGDFMTKLDLQDAYLTVPMNKQIRQLLHFVWEDIPPIRAGPSPVGFYETVETGSSISKGTGHPPPHLPGRHAADGSVREAVTVPCRDNKWALTPPGIHPELQEVPHRSKTDNGIPGFHSGLRADDPLSSQCKGLQDLLSCTEPITCFSKAISQANLPSHFLSTSNRASPSSLQSPTEAKEPGSFTRRPLLQPKDHPVSRESAGSPVVDPKHINRPTKAYPQSLSSPHSGNRCFPDWVGGVLSELRGVHGEHLDWGGSKAPYQLARIKGAFLALQCFVRHLSSSHILLLMDNQVAITYINKKGGTTSRALCDLVLTVWTWCLERSITVEARHLPGHQNTRADFESSHQTDSGDWHLNKAVFKMMTNQMGDCSISTLLQVTKILS